MFATGPRAVGFPLRSKWSVSAYFAKGCAHITNSKWRKHP